jgi:exodeoxyribonuclease V alpha subunit
LDTQFAKLMVRLHGEPNAELEHAARMASAWRAAGHICLPIEKLAGALDGLADRLRATQVVGAPGEWKPLILDHGGRLYLQRYWQYEHELAAAIRARLDAAPPAVDRTLLDRGLREYFGSEEKTRDQRAAAELAVTRRFCVVTGGPGTGKTRTVAAILALLQGQAEAAGHSLRVALAAPTGKAAARMSESIAVALTGFSSAGMPQEAVTLHRLLGITTDAPLGRFNAHRPLTFDAVIVDEASMVDLALMAKLFAATPPAARIILLGDKDQLASVEAGHVLGDICESGAAKRGADAPIARQIVTLRQNFRFGEGSGIHRLAELVNAGFEHDAINFLATHSARDIAAAPLPRADALPDALREPVCAGFHEALTAQDPREAIEKLGRFRLLCALRRGPYGVENLNRLAEAILTAAGLISRRTGVHYAGRPVLITTNDYALRLFNGDIGMLLPDPDAGGELRAFFVGPDGALRRIAPARLPPHETVWAMTVHKSQGSEFSRVLLVLPDRENRVCTRELIYTAITRAREKAELWFEESVLRAAIAQRTERTSGLREALWDSHEKS